MVDEKSLVLEISELKVLQGVTHAYAEIASARMRKTRDSVLQDRDFLGAIHDIFQEVLISYKRQVDSLAKKKRMKRGESITFLAHNGKKVVVLLSANTGLYGDIVGKTFDLFMEEVRKGGIEVTIVGKLGASLFEQVAVNIPYTYFDLADYGLDEDFLGMIIKHIVQYEEIQVYYGKFNSVVNQAPSMYRISVSVSTLEKEREGREEFGRYIFEPSLEKILMFFETEIFASVFNQVVRESQLAKFGSRITAMSLASENINDVLKKTQLKKLKLSHIINNQKQLNALSGLLLWGK